jgi:pimeloyl-ACP methyl ester carboxylesterase
MLSPGSLYRKILAGISGANWFGRVLLISGGLLIVAATIFVLTPQFRTGFHTGLFVSQILNAPIKPQSWFTREPLREQLNYPRPVGEGSADLYRIPDHQRRAAVLLFLGANAAGRDDPDVINLGNALARAGFVVMLHWSPTMVLQNTIDLNEIENLVWAFRYLLEQDFVDRRRAGMGGFSVGGSFVLIAAADPRIRDDVVFINSFGAYYNAQDLFLQIASRTRFYDGLQEPWEVDRLTWLVFANELIGSVDDPAEHELLEQRFLRNDEAGDLGLEDLSDQAQAVRKLLEGTTLEEAATLFRRMPAEFHQKITSISPSSHVHDLKARVMVMHDRHDSLIPVGESRRLAAALRRKEDFRYTETRMFDHVRAGSGGDLWQLIAEAGKMYRHMYGIIRVAR